ncbi:MAG TPA: DUF4350 domain-containing protein [Chitinophagaceae bacterium]|jgi:hypothetical protein
MKWMKWYIIVLVTLVVLYMVAEYNRPRTIDWSPTFSSHDKIPYGTWIVFNELKSYFHDQPATEQKLPVYDHVNNSVAENELYLLINGSLGTTETDEDELYRYIKRGNTVFIATESLDKSFKEKFHVDIDWYGSLVETRKDSATINFTNPLLKSRKDYSLEKGTLDGYFDKVDTGHTTILGVNNYGQANFIRVNIGSGFLYLHAAPKVFTNYFALKDNNIEYINKVFSFFSDNPSAIYWDEYYKSQGSEAEPQLNMVLSQGNLRWAYYIALLSMVLYVLFQLKRRQRIIPIVAPPKNDSKEFVETVSRVYYNQKHHRNIADKKIGHWLDYIRVRFGISTREINEEFAGQLSHRSGIPLSEITEIVNQVSMCRISPAISAEELLYINQLIDNFYKQAR